MVTMWEGGKHSQIYMYVLGGRGMGDHGWAKKKLGFICIISALVLFMFYSSYTSLYLITTHV